MKKVFQISILFLCLFLFGQNKQPEYLRAFTNKVVKISDGDTFIVQDKKLNLIRIRIAFIDAPETTQDYGLTSKTNLNNLILNKNVQLKCLKNPDLYGRMVCKVFLKQPNKELLFVNEWMIQNGNAWHYSQYDNELESIQRLKTLQDKAQQNKLGLWGTKFKPIEPWIYRKNKKLNINQ